MTERGHCRVAGDNVELLITYAINPECDIHSGVEIYMLPFPRGTACSNLEEVMHPVTVTLRRTQYNHPALIKYSSAYII